MSPDDDTGEEARRTADRLAGLIRVEAHRAMSEAAVRPDPVRLADGWERRFIAEGMRAAEMAELYEKLGFEVAVDPVRSEELAGECEACRVVALLAFKSIYTRRR